MTYSKKENEQYVLKLLLMEIKNVAQQALNVLQGRLDNKELLKIVKRLEWKKIK